MGSRLAEFSLVGLCAAERGPLGHTQALRRRGRGDFTMTSPGKDSRGPKASGLTVIEDSLSPPSLNIWGTPSTVLVTGPLGVHRLVGETECKAIVGATCAHFAASLGPER